MKYLYQIGETQTYIYNNTINKIADNNNGKLTTEIINKTSKILRQEYGALFEAYFDDLALLSYFMQRENVNEITVIEKTRT